MKRFWRLANRCTTEAVLALVRVRARLAGATIELHVHPTARVRRIDVRFAPGSHNVLRIGAHSSLDRDVAIRWAGGRLEIGDGVDVRRDVRMMISGVLRLQGPNVLSWGVVVHCDEEVSLAPQVTVGEWVTIADGAHHHLDGAWHVDQLTTSPVAIGGDTWVGAKATITKGVRIGRSCVVAANAVVTRDVPDGHVALGVPATVRPLRAPDATSRH